LFYKNGWQYEVLYVLPEESYANSVNIFIYTLWLLCTVYKALSIFHNM